MIKKWLGWESVDISTYRDAYNLYGGNISTHPDVLEFQHQSFNIPHKYYAMFSKAGTVSASICIWDNKFLANDPKNCNNNKRHLPVPKDELIIPIKNNKKIILPVSSRFISDINSHNIINCSSSINSNRRICLVDDKYKNSSSKNVERKFYKFMDIGGSIVDCNDINIDDICDIFLHLTEVRWGRFGGDKQLTKDFFRTVEPYIFGNILFIKGQPLAYNFTTKLSSCDNNYIEYIHSGTDFNLVPKNISPGEILIYSNIKKAFHTFKNNVRYSFGNPSRDYKKRWCSTVPLSRSAFPI